MDHPRDSYLDPLPVSARLREFGIGLAMAGIISAALFGPLWAKPSPDTAVAGTACADIEDRASLIYSDAATRWIDAGIITLATAQTLTPEQAVMLLTPDEAAEIDSLAATYTDFHCE